MYLSGYHVHLGDDAPAPPFKLSDLIKPPQLVLAPPPAVVAPTQAQIDASIAYRREQAQMKNSMWMIGIGVAAGVITHLLTNRR